MEQQEGYNEFGEEQYQRQQSVMPPQYREEKESNDIGIIRELSSKRILEQLRNNLKGFFWDYEKKVYVKMEGFEPLMNEKGIAKYLSIMSSVISDVVTFSSYSEKEVPKLTLHVCEKAIPVIHINYWEYGIKEKSDLQILDLQIFNLALGAFKKAIGAGDRSVIGRTITENIMTRGMFGNPPSTSGSPDERRGFFGNLFRRNR